MHSDVFISYSRADIAAAERLEQALSAADLAAWRDKNEIRPGGSFPDDIAAAIDSCFAVVWLASAASVQSTWVRRELAYATDAKKLIIPVHLNREVLGQMPPGLRLLFPHIDYVNLDEQDWDRGVAAVVQSLRETGVRSGRLTLSEPPAVQTSALPPAVSDWPDQIGAVETPAGLDLLPIDERSPLVLGVAIDVSGSMQTAIQNDGGGQRNRLEGVLDAVRDLARRYHTESALPELASGTELAKLFAYGFGFADRAEKYGKLGALAQRLLKEAPPIPSRVFRGAVRDLLEIAGVESHTLSLKELDSRWSEIERGLWEQRMDLFGTTQMRTAMETVAERFAAEFAPYAGTPHSALFLVSDGESKDGSPLEACRKVARWGTIVLACYLTGQDVAESRRLYARPQPDWPEGAVTLFRCSSVLQEDSLLLPVLREKGWTAYEGDRLFIQLNQSALMSEFVSFVLDLAPRAKQGPPPPDGPATPDVGIRGQLGSGLDHQNAVTIHGVVTGQTVTIVSGNNVTTIVHGIDQAEFNRAESDRYKDLGRAKIQLWGERLNRERRWEWDLLGHAIDHYVDAIRRDPDNQHAWTNLAYALHLVGETEKAYQCLERSFHLAKPDPNHPGNNYKQVKRAIDNKAYLSGGTVERPVLPSWFWEKHGRLPLGR